MQRYWKHSVIVLFGFAFLAGLASCQHRSVARVAKRELIADSLLNQAHVGIAVYNITAQQWIYRYQSDHYFIPASNTKLFSTAAMLENLGDRVPGLEFLETDTAIWLKPTADPTFLHPAFADQPVLRFLQQIDPNKNIYVVYPLPVDRPDPLGPGWQAEDILQGEVPPRSLFPVNGNRVEYLYQPDGTVQSYPEQLNAAPFVHQPAADCRFSSIRKKDVLANRYERFCVDQPVTYEAYPFNPDNDHLYTKILSDTLKRSVVEVADAPGGNWKMIYSRPMDSVLQKINYYSDNFLAEQGLLMAAKQRIGRFNTAQLIDSLLKTDWADLPQLPNWVDGSGVSRYNLQTPENLIYILRRLYEQQGIERLKRLLPTGGQGTLRQYFRSDSGYVYAKTGGLSNIQSLSGYVHTQKGQVLAFSILANHYPGKLTPVRRRIESFISYLRRQY